MTTDRSFPLRKVGKGGPAVPALGFGLMGLTLPVYGKCPTEDEQFAVLDKAYELGMRFWDTAEYAPSPPL